MFAILGWMLAGLIIGAIARFVVPGPQPMGLLKTMLLGVAGSFVGGFIGALIFGGELFTAAGWIGSVIGAVLVLIVVERAGRSTT